jgi:phage tail sheath protein FI
MVQVSFPGVYIQEVASGSRTITGVSTSIAAFVGMAKAGPPDLPIGVQGFLDYSRVFSDDISQGEMTDQVRQFFLNGGSQAFIVRIGDANLKSAAITLTATNGATLTLTAISAGVVGNNLRVSVDYNTLTPERTFNLTLFIETLDASGNAQVSSTEVHANVSMDPNDPRYVVDEVNANSSLVTAAATGNGPATATAGVSSSGRIDATDILQAFTDAMGTNTQGKFRISIGGSPFVTISVPKPSSGAVTAAQIKTAIVNQAGVTDATTIAVTVVGTTNQFLQIASAGTSTVDILLDRAADSDVAAPMGLGTAQGGVEVGSFSAHRPPPSGLVSILGGTNLSNLMAFALSLKSGWTAAHSLTLTGGSIPLDITADTVTFPNTTGTTMASGAATTDPLQLSNVRANLAAIANAITGNPKSGWKASVGTFSYRLVLVPKQGPSSLVGGMSFVAANAPDGFVTGSIFDSVQSISAAAAPTVIGNDGGLPPPTAYATAFTLLDQNVDLFNLIVLPRSAADTTDQREDVWGPASSFALARRAFLIMDAGLDVTAVQDATKPNDAAREVVSLRAGLVKDHSALYWPRIKVNPDGNTRFIDPSGSLAGIMSRIDNTRGVWKAPAGLEADVRGALGVAVPMTDPENGILNPLALNAIRLFANGIVSWGARTMDGFDNSGDDDFKYVPVRRVTLFIEESLVRGLKFAVFEPNAEPLWGQIRQAVGGFLNTLFRQGAFAGKNASDAYFVKVDSETTTQNDINLGIVNVIVGFAPLKPAEFVVITIKQMAGQVQV